jgi:hypothetical protein
MILRPMMQLILLHGHVKLTSLPSNHRGSHQSLCPDSEQACPELLTFSKRHILRRSNYCMWVGGSNLNYDIKHIEDDSDNVMWGSLAQPFKVSYFFSILLWDLPNSVRKHNTCYPREAGRLPITWRRCGPLAEAVLGTQLIRCSFCDITFGVPSPSSHPPPTFSPTDSQCDTQRKCKNRAEYMNCTVSGHDGFVQATLLKCMTTSIWTKDSILLKI